MALFVLDSAEMYIGGAQVTNFVDASLYSSARWAASGLGAVGPEWYEYPKGKVTGAYEVDVSMHIIRGHTTN